MNYDYRAAVLADVEEAFAERGIKTRLDDDALEALIDDLRIDDGVTGNGSGSYTFNTWTAEENLCHNWELLNEALQDLGCEIKLDDPEGMDVTIRYYLLDGVVREVNEALPEGEDEV